MDYPGVGMAVNVLSFCPVTAGPMRIFKMGVWGAKMAKTAKWGKAVAKGAAAATAR